MKYVIMARVLLSICTTLVLATALTKMSGDGFDELIHGIQPQLATTV